MSPLDWILLAVLALSVLQGLRHGLLREVLALVGAICGWLAACRWAGPLAHVFLRLTRSYWLAEIFSFLTVLLTIMLIAHVVGRLLAGGVRSIGLGWLDRLAGGLFGFVRGLLVVALGFLLLSLFFPASAWVRHSRLAPYGLAAARRLAVAAPQPMAGRIRSGAHALHLQVQGPQ